MVREWRIIGDRKNWIGKLEEGVLRKIGKETLIKREL